MHLPTFIRTERGTIETTGRIISILVGIGTTVGFLTATGAWVTARNGRVTNAVQYNEFRPAITKLNEEWRDTALVLHEQIREIRDTTRQNSAALRVDERRILGILCDKYRNPREWCGDGNKP